MSQNHAFTGERQKTDRAQLSSSLEPLETSAGSFRQSRSQQTIHARDWVTRTRLIRCLGEAEGTRLERRAHRLSECAASPLLHVDSSGGVVVQLQLCRDRICPTCQRLRGRDLAEQVAKLVGEIDSPRFMTLTLKGRDGENLEAMLDRLATGFRTVRKADRWGDRVAGGIAAIEITRGAAGGRWHAHLHLITEGWFYAQRDLSADWKAATGDSPIVDIRAVSSRRAVARYICEYVAKPADLSKWEDDDVREFAEATHGRRMIQTFGTMHGRPLKKPKNEVETKTWRYLTSARLIRFRATRGCELAQRALNIGSCCGGVLMRSLGFLENRALGPAAADCADVHEFVRLCEKIERLGPFGEGPPPRPAPLPRQMPLAWPGSTI